MLVGSDLCRVSLAWCRHTPGLLSSLRERAALPLSITFSTSYTEMDSASRRSERVVATLTRLRSVSDVRTVERELATLGRGDARHERTDQGNERYDAFIAIQALRKGLATAPGLPSTAASADNQTRWQDAISKASTAASADIQTRWDGARMLASCLVCFVSTIAYAAPAVVHHGCGSQYR